MREEDSGFPQMEIDEPFDSGKLVDESLKQQKIVAKEKDRQRKQLRWHYAFWLAVACVVTLIVFGFADYIISVIILRKDPSLTEGALEAVKALLFTLGGYLFAQKSEKG